MVLTLDPETEKLARDLAAAKGKSVKEVVKDAIEHSAQEAGLEAGTLSPAEVNERLSKMLEVADRTASRPRLDHRSPEDVIGYDEWGLPR